jgi:hypothetical protein
MAYISYKPAQGTSAAVAVGVPAQAAVAVPDNCHTMIVYNPNTDDALLQWVGWPAAFNPAEAVVIPAGASITLAIGQASNRVQDSGLLAGNYFTEVPFYDITAGAGTLYITYVNSPTA